MAAVPDQLKGVYLRLDQADKHIALCERSIKRYMQRTPFTPALEIRPEVHKILEALPNLPEPDRVPAIKRTEPTSIPIIATKVRPLPQDLPLSLGDAVHNLRSSLDHLAWQLVLSAGKTPIPRAKDGTSFPIVGKAASASPLPPSKVLLKPKTTDEIERRLHALQPGTRTDVAKDLEQLRDLNNHDKHQALTLMWGFTAGGQSTVTFPNGKIVGRRYLGSYVSLGGVWRMQLIEDGTRVGSLLVSDYLVEMLEKSEGEVEVSAEVQIDIALKPGATHDEPAESMVVTLQRLASSTRSAVAQFHDQF